MQTYSKFHYDFFLCYFRSILFNFQLFGEFSRYLCLIYLYTHWCVNMPLWLGGSVTKESTCNAGDTGLIPELKRSPGEGNGNQLQYFCLENPMYRRA